MFIMSKRNIELPSPDGSMRLKVQKDFIGDIPDWAADTAYFRALVKDGKIAVPASTKDKHITASEAQPVNTYTGAGSTPADPDPECEPEDPNQECEPEGKQQETKKPPKGKGK